LPIAPKKREMLSDSNLKIPSEKIEEHNSTTTADEKILGSSSMPDKNRTDNDEKVKALPPPTSALSLPVPRCTLSLSLSDTPSVSLFMLSMVSL